MRLIKKFTPSEMNFVELLSEDDDQIKKIINKLKYLEEEKVRENRFFKKIHEHKKRRY